MQDATQNAVHALLRADATLTPQARRDILAAMQNNGRHTPPEAKPERIVRRKESARMLGCTTRTIDNLSRTGVLPRVRLPGRERGLGVRESDVLAIIAGKGTLKQTITEGGLL